MQTKTKIKQKSLLIVCLGGLVLAAFDQVPAELRDNSVILGCLSFFVALVMLYDLSDPMARHVTDTTQTEPDLTTTRTTMTTATNTQPLTTVSSNVESGQMTNGENPSIKTSNSMKTHQSQPMRSDRNAINESVVDNGPHQMQSERLANANQMYAQTEHIDSPDVEDITKNGHYHRSDNVDFVQMQSLPQAEQPVFERVLLPEKKRPTLNKMPNPQTRAVVQTVNHNALHSSPPSANLPSDFVDNYAPADYSHYHNTNYNQKPQYAVAQRHQPVSNQPYHQQQPIRQSTYAQISSPSVENVPRNVHKAANRNYANDDFGEQFIENPPQTKYVYRNTGYQHNGADMNRYRDHANQHAYHNQQPMMVIRNYAQPSSTRTTIAGHDSGNYDRRNVSAISSANNSQMHRSNVNKMQNVSQRQPARKCGNNGDGCGKQRRNCYSDADDDDGVVDFRKMNSAIRPGFVASAAKMWDKRAAENSNELNTIV